MSPFILLVSVALAAEAPTEDTPTGDSPTGDATANEVAVAPGLSSATRKKRRGRKDRAPGEDPAEALPPDATTTSAEPVAEEPAPEPPVAEEPTATAEPEPPVAEEATPAPTDPLGDIEIPEDTSVDAQGHPWPRSPEGIASAIEGLVPTMEDCASDLLDGGDEELLLLLRFRMQFRVAPEGDTGDVEVVDGTSGPFTDCLASRLSALRFEAGELQQDVQVPVYLRISR